MPTACGKWLSSSAGNRRPSGTCRRPAFSSSSLGLCLFAAESRSCASAARTFSVTGSRCSPQWACPSPSSLCSSLCAAQSAHPLCPRSRTPFSSRLSGLECVACGTMGEKICRMEEKLNSGPFCSFGEFGTCSSETLPATFTCVSSLKASEKA